jgi:UDP-glucuronate 4-epimerase
MKKKILITGAVGFIGFYLTKFLLKKNFKVIGVDNINNYYSKKLKLNRLKILLNFKNFFFYKKDITNQKDLEKIFIKNKPQVVINLAAMAGVRFSIKQPKKYIKNNINGFQNILELSNKYKVKHLVYASSSSIYGMNSKIPFSEEDRASHPISVYAATKRSNELLAHVYSNMYKLPTTGLRFFTVYGPWGRPDMALFKFVKSALKNKKIDLYNFGNHIRDFTYIDDVVKIIYLSINKIPKLDKSKSITEFQSKAPWRIYNISSSRPVKLKKFVSQIEKQLNTKINFKNLPLQVGDVKIATGSMTRTISKFGYKPKYQTNYGIKKFVSWYKEYYKLT